jgi:hypothetical protein
MLITLAPGLHLRSHTKPTLTTHKFLGAFFGLKTLCSIHFKWIIDLQPETNNSEQWDLEKNLKTGVW